MDKNKGKIANVLTKSGMKCKNISKKAYVN